jgi:phosphoribosylaminoimidazolecarboxamide formyltransferase/IMP cyclohydrolase
MSIRDMKGLVRDEIPVQNVLMSVFDKTGLDVLVYGIMEASPNVRFMSTGGTYKKVKELLGDRANEHLMEVAEYTKFPEMEGGLVKTLHPKIHAGILGERNNPAHQDYLKSVLDNGVYIDMVVVNLYPFDQVIAKPGVTFEQARGNIDIGGPTMIRAAAKNFMSCASVCDPENYGMIVEHLSKNNGTTNFVLRSFLASKVFAATAEYDANIAKYMAKNIVGKPEDVRACYKFE